MKIRALVREDQINAVKLFADGLTLVYHEARHVRFLIKAGHAAPADWEHLLSLPRNRVEAWKALQSIRRAAGRQRTAPEAATLFEQRFGRSLDDLERLYENANWRHASAVGGHAWQGVTALVAALGRAIEQKDLAAVGRACVALLEGRHNNGPLRNKILELDRALGVTTDS